MRTHDADMKRLSDGAADREELWVSFLAETGSRAVAEVGVFKGAFAERVLGDCPSIERYYMIDPWRHLDDWNKPANRDVDAFEVMYQQVLDRTSAYEEKRVVLRGKTTEVVGEIPDESLDFAYVDGDHTLRGVTIDLVRLFPKIRPGGYLAGDDFCRTIFQHSAKYEPTLVFPFAVYFAEAVGCPVYALPHEQFVIVKDPDAGHAFHDLTGSYDRLTLKEQLDDRPVPRARRSPAAAAAAPPATGAAAGPASVVTRLREAARSRLRG